MVDHRESISAKRPLTFGVGWAARLSWLAVQFLLLITFPAVSNAATCAEPAAVKQIRADHLEVLNTLRAQHGLPVVVKDQALDHVAQAFACSLVASRTFSHVGPDGSGLPTRLRAGGISYCVATENLASGYDSIRTAMSGWVRSPGHYHNLVNPNVRLAGLGVVQETSGQYMWVEIASAHCDS